MEKFIVSARKYRPQAFDTVVGQPHITTTLKNAIHNNQLAHAFLFCGPRGVGKTTCARILAKTINCENLQPNGEACNNCASCKSFNEGTSLNIYELDAASNNSVDDIRALAEQVRFAPQAGKYKVYIVDEVHMLSPSAFNAFLKTLEEPPPFVIFILATTEKYKIIPTILSRCQIFDFKRITINDTVTHLQQIADKEKLTAEKAALQLIAQKSEGCMRDALSILDKITSFTNGDVTYQNALEHLNILDHEYYFKLMHYLLQQDIGAAMLLYDEINSKGFEGDVVLNGFAEFLRNMLVCKDAKAAALLDVVEGMQDRYIKAAKETSAAYIVGALNILNEAEVNYKMARNKRLHTEITLIKLNFLQQAIELTSENGTLVKKKRIDAGVAYKVQPVSSIQFVTAVHAEAGNQNSSRLFIQPPLPESNISVEAQQEITAADSNGSEIAVANENTEKNASVVNAGKKKINNTKKNLLEALRDQYGQAYIIEEVKEAEALSLAKLKNCWINYAEKLLQQKKHSAANTFKTATLQIETDNLFAVTVKAYTQQKFIEQEKTVILDEIQQAFCNRSITFKVLVQEDAKEEIPPQMRLNNRQRFERIAEGYPLVRELKNRLNLELDY